MDGFAIQAQAQYAGGDPERWRTHAERWRELGATHLAIATHNAGPTDVDGHLAASPSTSPPSPTDVSRQHASSELLRKKKKYI